MLDIIRRRSARSEAGNKSAVFLQVVRNIDRIEIYDVIEKCKPYDQQCINDDVRPALPLRKRINKA